MRAAPQPSKNDGGLGVPFGFWSYGNLDSERKAGLPADRTATDSYRHVLPSPTGRVRINLKSGAISISGGNLLDLGESGRKRDKRPRALWRKYAWCVRRWARLRITRPNRNDEQPGGEIEARDSRRERFGERWERFDERWQRNTIVLPCYRVIAYVRPKYRCGLSNK